MNAHTPEDVHLRWLDSINAGDLDGVLTLYEPDSSIVDTDGNLVEASTRSARSLPGCSNSSPRSSSMWRALCDAATSHGCCLLGGWPAPPAATRSRCRAQRPISSDGRTTGPGGSS